MGALNQGCHHLRFLCPVVGTCWASKMGVCGASGASGGTTSEGGGAGGAPLAAALAAQSATALPLETKSWPFMCAAHFTTATSVGSFSASISSSSKCLCITGVPSDLRKPRLFHHKMLECVVVVTYAESEYTVMRSSAPFLKAAINVTTSTTCAE